MYKEDNLVHILTILESIEKIKIYSKGFDSPDEFFWADNQLNFNGTVSLLIAIGEESKKIDSKLKEEFPEIKWKAIAGIRDKLAHDYRGIDPNIVWLVIQDELEKLKETGKKMLLRVDYDKKILAEALKTKYYSHLGFLKLK